MYSILKTRRKYCQQCSKKKTENQLSNFRLHILSQIKHPAHFSVQLSFCSPHKFKHWTFQNKGPVVELICNHVQETIYIFVETFVNLEVFNVFILCFRCQQLEIFYISQENILVWGRGLLVLDEFAPSTTTVFTSSLYLIKPLSSHWFDDCYLLGVLVKNLINLRTLDMCILKFQLWFLLITLMPDQNKHRQRIIDPKNKPKH